MQKQLERRSYNFEIRAEGDEETAILTGRPIVYNSITDMGLYDEMIAEGALDDTDLTDVRFLVNHDKSKIPLARSRRNNGNNTMQFSVDSQGLNLDWVKLDIANNTEARALRSAVQRGDISGMSFLFSIDGYEWENLESEKPLKRITKIGTVVEVSAVTFPAYGGTEIHARSKEALESAKRELENARAQLAKKTVDTGDIELAKLKTKILTGGF